jgi:hypothetical protein
MVTQGGPREYRDRDRGVPVNSPLALSLSKYVVFCYKQVSEDIILAQAFVNLVRDRGLDRYCVHTVCMHR